MTPVQDRTEEIIMSLHEQLMVNGYITKDVKLQEGTDKYLRIEFYYDLGGMNYFTSSAERRGYYISVSPIEKGNGYSTYRGFSGVKQFLGEEVKRKSNKAHKLALKDLTPQKLSAMLAQVEIG